MDEAREPEDRIEHIVKEAAEGAQFEFSPAAWDAMEQKLDAVNPVPFSIWKILFPLTGVAVLLMVLLWPIGAQNIAKRQAQVVKERVQEFLDKQAENVEQNEEEAADQGETGNTEPDQTALQKADNADEPAPTNESSEQASNKNTITNTQEQVADAQPSIRRATEPNIPPIADEENQVVSEPDAVSLGGSNLRETGSGAEMLEVRWNPRLLVLPGFNGSFEMDSTQFREGVPTNYFQKSRWAFNAMVSLDMSATGLDGFTDPGTMFGLGVEYYFAPTWSIQSGAAIAVKKYSALGSEYDIEWGAARIENLESVLANCLVIDIPINIRKYFYTKKGNTWFASTGISSYLMLREDYDYEYIQNDPNWGEESSYRNENQHYLGILNMSFGYETPLSKNLGLAVEPFVKLPLTGIGQGSVKFLSFGTVIAVKLRK